MSGRDELDLQYSYRPTGGSDNNRNYEQATLFNLTNVKQSNKSSNTNGSKQPLPALASKQNSEQGLDEISRLINEQDTMDHENKDINAIFKDEKLYDQPKKAIYGIQPAPNMNAF